MNLRKYIDIINEASKSPDLSDIDPELQDVAEYVVSHDISQNVMASMVQYLTKMVQADQQADQQQVDQPDQEPVEPEVVPSPEPAEEPAVKEAEEAEADQGTKMQFLSLLSQVDPNRKDQIWAYMNKEQIEDYIVPALIEKDINREDDHQRIVSLFVEAPGSLEDKVALAMKLDTTGERPNTGGGIINTKKLTTQGKGSINDLINVKKTPLIDYIKERLIRMRVYPSTTSAATGDGEAFFLILGAGISKRGKGDLNVANMNKKDKLHNPSPLEINGKEVEVKALGARLKGFGGKGTYGDGASYYKTFNQDLINIIGQEGNNYLGQLLPGSKATGGWGNGKNPLHFGLQNLHALSTVLKEFSKKNGATPKDVRAMFLGMIKHVYPKIEPDMYNDLLKTIDKFGSFNVEEFRKQWFLMTYKYYMETSRDDTGQTYDGILFIHQGDFTYSYIKGPEAMSEQWGDFELSTTLYNWTDTQSVAPKITYGKEDRPSKKPKKAAKTGSPTKDLAPELAKTTAARTKKAPVAMTRTLK